MHNLPHLFFCGKRKRNETPCFYCIAPLFHLVEKREREDWFLARDEEKRVDFSCPWPFNGGTLHG